MISHSLLLVLPFLLFLNIPLSGAYQNATMDYCIGEPAYAGTSPILTTGAFYDFLLNLIETAPTTADKSCSSSINLMDGSGAIWAVAQCRFDISLSDCSRCLNNSYQTTISRNCANSAVRFDLCLLRYSGQILSQLDENEFMKTVFNGSRAVDPPKFKSTVTGLLEKVLESIQTLGSRQSGGMTNYLHGEIYVLEQCIADLSKEDCGRCIQGALDRISMDYNGSTGMQVLRLSCAMSYQSFRFFDPLLLPMTILNDSGAGDLPQANQTLLGKNGEKRIKEIFVIVGPVAFVVLLLLLTGIWLYLKRRNPPRDAHNNEDGQDMGIQPVQFDLETLKAATNNFNDQNKLGQGGCGSVYKGVIKDAQGVKEIAVKRVFASSNKGLEQLKKEVMLVAKLQHTNLVKLLGYCLEVQEKLLVYEYLRNRSLNHFLFAPMGQKNLDWGKRFKLIVGICRGLLYLHHDSGQDIIHRDLKASNILLDNSMCPKISDFDLARTFDVNKTHETTEKGAGTFGYMAPELRKRKHYSMKSDVFSYGVLLLEIVTGQRITTFELEDPNTDLLTHVWQRWNENEAMEVMDQDLGGQYHQEEALRCIHIGLLCVQKNPMERPSMQQVILMINSSNSLPAPSEPGVYDENADEENRGGIVGSVNDVTLSGVEAR